MKAQCDGEGCSRQLEVPAGMNPSVVMFDAGWQMVQQPNWGVDTYCPDHRTDLQR